LQKSGHALNPFEGTNHTKFRSDLLTLMFSAGVVNEIRLGSRRVDVCNALPNNKTKTQNVNKNI